MSERPRVITPEQRARFESAAEPPIGAGGSGGVGPWPRWFIGPVGWMLSPELVASLRAIVRQRLDPRRWMWLDDGHAHLEDAGGAADPTCAPGASTEPGRFRPREEVVAPASGEIWFDYVSDIGDGFGAMYSVAYLLQADLALTDHDRDDLTAAGCRPQYDDDTGERFHPVALAVATPAPADPRTAAGPRALPRGQFLFVGGDTAYHVADRATLVSRLQAPMYWAARHLDDDGKLPAGERRIYGIPGNHDWYDDLDGFSRVFRSGRGHDDPRATHARLAHDRLEAARPIDLVGFRRRQHASYVGIALPWGWQLWGLDIDQRLDERQRRYFDSLQRDAPPAKLVLCTPSPAVVFHRVDASDAHQDALAALGLPQLHADAPATSTAGQSPVPPGACRLDLSGDVHHYARYSGAWDPAGADPAFASVVSGLGGAFLHATDTVHAERAPVALFPEPAIARAACAPGTRWTTLFSGGWMRVVPILLCLGLSWVLLQDGLAPHLADRALHAAGFQRVESEYTPESYAAATSAFLAREEALANIWRKMFVMLLGPGALVGAFFLARRIARHHARDPGAKITIFDLLRGAPLPRARAIFTSNYGAVTLLAAAGLGLLVLGPSLLEDYPHDQTSDVIVVWTLVAAPIGAGVVTAWKLGAGRPTGARVAGGLLGGFHLAVQLFTIVLLARLGLAAWPWILGAAAIYLLANGTFAPALVRWNAPIWLVLLFWFGLLAGFGWAIVHGADHRIVIPPAAPGVELVLAMGLPLLVAMPVGCAHFGWYLAAMRRLQFHNNELGGAAKVDRYRQFIRFRVTPDAITGYVIGLEHIIDAPTQRGTSLRPFVIDTFTVKPRPPSG